MLFEWKEVLSGINRRQQFNYHNSKITTLSLVIYLLCSEEKKTVDKFTDNVLAGDEITFWWI